MPQSDSLLSGPMGGVHVPCMCKDGHKGCDLVVIVETFAPQDLVSLELGDAEIVVSLAQLREALNQQEQCICQRVPLHQCRAAKHVYDHETEATDGR